MGFFSWKTNDTNRSIGNIYGDLNKVFTVYMKDNDGNTWIENGYEGYGVIGDKDYFVLLAEMNNLSTREEGLRLYYDNDDENTVFPILVEDMDYEWKNEKPETCEYQGYFYPEGS